MLTIEQQAAVPHSPILRFSKHATMVSVVCLVLIAFAGGFWTGKYVADKAYKQQLALNNVRGEREEKSYPLLKYSFSELEKRGGVASEIKINRVLEDHPEFTAYVFSYQTEGRKMSGQLNVPKLTDPSTPLPVIMMMRGFVPTEEYVIGKGSSNTAAALAKAGYITFAPDFLGFGESDPPPSEVLAERFVKPLNVMDLYASIKQLDHQDLVYQKKRLAVVDARRLGLWGHSNGGQISLSFLEISGYDIPTVLWAPVTKEFPYSVLYFTDESEDKGKGLRAVLAGFEKDYNIDDFSIGNRLDHVAAKIQLHQGTADDAVPKSWSDDFYSYFTGKGKKDQLEYFVYPGADHGLTQDLQIVVERTIAFFDREVKHRPDPTATPTFTITPAPSVQPATSSATVSTATPSATITGSLTPTKTATPSGVVR